MASPMRVAAFDIGTNTILCLIAEMQGRTRLKTLWDQVITIRLGEGVDKTQKFSAQALERLDGALAIFLPQLHLHGVEKVVVAATSASRDVRNREEYLQVLNKYNLVPQVLSGEEEASFTFKGAFNGPIVSTAAVIDVGGGSTELTIGTDQEILYKKSFDVGSVRMTERHVNIQPLSPTDFQALHQKVKEAFKEFKGQELLPSLREVRAVAGTPTTLAAMIQGKDFNRTRIEGFVITRAQILEWAQKLSKLTIAERCELPGLDKGRADVIVAGLLILLEALNCLEQESLVVSTQGLRYGILEAEEFYRHWSAP